MTTSVKRPLLAFTLVEMIMSIGCGSLILAAVVAASVSLERSYSAVEAYSTAEEDQLRVLDYIAMDCRRATGATVSTVTVNGVTENALVLTLPAYYTSITSGATPNPPILTNGTLSYGSGSTVTIEYYQSGNNFSREVIVGASDNTTPIAKNVATFTVTSQDLTSTVSCSVFFFPTFTHGTGTGTWRSGLANPDTAPSNGAGVDGDWYVINTTATDPTTIGNVYYRFNGSYSLVENVKATQVYCNTFLRNAMARQ